jgi:hypothetical protein
MERSIKYSIFLRDTWNEITNTILESRLKKEIPVILQSIQTCFKLEQEVVRELNRYKEMRPGEVKGYVKVLIEEMNHGTRWLRNDKTEAFAKEVESIPNNKINWYKIAAHRILPGMEELTFKQIVAAFYYHLVEFKQWLQGQIKEKSKGEHKKTALFYLLRDYYENGCRRLNRSHVLSLEADLKIPLKDRWEDLEEDNYKFVTTKRNNPQEFKKVYELLMETFKNENSEAFSPVFTDYEELEEAYPKIF